jgi:hypothetical protein
MKAVAVLREKAILLHIDGVRLAIFEFAIWRIPVSAAYVDGIKYRAWLAEEGRLELLHVIRIAKPKSIQELARLVERDFKNVHQDVTLLAQFGLIELKKVGPRRSAAPTAKFKEIVLAA